ncbi:MAG: hypothetical protein K9M99_02850 [Candidatus Cloacimonetes bacterium]|nr:hypothetical protein [Candidatus Cloacimonadota bacterium]
MNLKSLSRPHIDEITSLALPEYYSHLNYLPIILISEGYAAFKACLQITCFPKGDNPDFTKGYYQLQIRDNLQMNLKFFHYDPYNAIPKDPANMAAIYRLLFAIEDNQE